MVDGNGTETGHIISTTIGGHNGQPKQVLTFAFQHLIECTDYFRMECLTDYIIMYSPATPVGSELSELAMMAACPWHT